MPATLDELLLEAERAHAGLPEAAPCDN